MVADADRILALGLSHRTAPVEIRERLALDEPRVRAFLERLRSDGVADEALLISTCNRVELYAVPRDEARVREALLEHRGPRGESIEPYLYGFHGREAVRHLFRVASALDSLVLGEPQILGQVKDAVRVADESGSLGRLLHPLTQRGLAVAKRVRTETEIGRSTVGIGNAGVDLALQIFGDLRGKKCLLMGTGEMGRQVARALLHSGLDSLLVTNRTFQHAVDLAAEFSGTAVPFERLDDWLPQADIVLVATGAPRYLLEPHHIRRAMRARRYQAMFFVDLSVPRNVDPAIGDLEDAYLFNVDDLTRVVEEGREARAAAAAAADRLVSEEADRFVTGLADLDLGRDIARITQGAEAIRQAELARSKRLTDALDEAGRAQLDALTRAIVKKMLDQPIRELRSAAKAGDAASVALLSRLFDESKER
jgi:glutamyl-tRNA reductase